MADLRYPIGKYQPTATLSVEERRTAVERIAETPARLRAAVTGLTPAQLDTPYRPEGWTVRQVIHHLPDSHLNAYIRFKLALTENEPVIKPYDEALWADLPDSVVTPVQTSLALLGALHERWVVLLRGMSAGQFARRANHPELGVVTLDHLLAMYAWHGRHHVAHITSLSERQGWA